MHDPTTPTHLLIQAAERRATEDGGEAFFAGLVWPVANRESVDPWAWIVETAEIDDSDGSDPERGAAQLLLCQLPRGEEGSQPWNEDIDRIQVATRALAVEHLIRFCRAEQP
jgi:hypothetical protein